MLFFLTLVAMMAFAANSLLARLALLDETMGPAGFTGIRLAAGALLLAIILMRRSGNAGAEEKARPSLKVEMLPGSWRSALALLVYAYAFSLAYVTLGAATGAFVLFSTVQATMISYGLWKGERPGRLQWAGMALAAIGFVTLVGAGVTRPDPVGTALMIVSGVAWGVYSLQGRGTTDPVGATAGNFIRTVPAALILIAAALWNEPFSLNGIGLALLSGIAASALGYIVWYRVLPALAASTAAICQLSVPLIATIGGVVLIDESLTPRLLLAGTAILGGIAMAVLFKAPGKAPGRQAD